MGKHNFKELQIWQQAMEIVVIVYTISKDFPKEELYGLSAQQRRSAVSIPSNIAEGCGRGTDPQLVQFLNIAQGSAYELETQIYVAIRQNYSDKDKLEHVLLKISELQKMINGFKNKFV